MYILKNYDNDHYNVYVYIDLLKCKSMCIFIHIGHKHEVIFITKY